MLYRKIEEQIKEHLLENKDKILLVEGARQVVMCSETLC